MISRPLAPPTQRPTFARFRSLIVAGCCSALLVLSLTAEEAPKTDPRYPFRTDFANANLPWYQPKPLEFPPHHSDRRIGGELISADFILRTGQFRVTKTGEIVEFTMPPYGAVNYLNAEADLRDIPLGTFFLFFLNQDSQGGFTRLATMQDQFTMDASHSFSYKLDEVKLAEGKLLTTKQSLAKNQPDLGKKELIVKDETRVWKAGQQIKLTDLVVGDELLFNTTGKTADSQGWCSDIWVGADTFKAATEQQAKKFADFTKRRGIPGWINKTEGNTVTVTFFSGDAKNFKTAWMTDLAVGKVGGKLCVANEQLRTWNPPVDGESFTVLEVKDIPKESYGCSGVQITVKVTNMLEGFRKGRVVRIFAPGWKAQDQFYGESLMGYGFGRMLDQELVENPAKEYPEQYPFRTDFGNEGMSWYRVQPGVKPPPSAEHEICGEIVKVDVADNSGQFKTDRTGEVVDFTILPGGSIKIFNADARLVDLPVGIRCRFDMFQDEKGAFTQTTFVRDEFTHLASNAISYRLEEPRLTEGKLRLAKQLPEVKNYNGDMEKTPDIGQSEVLVTPETRVWKGVEQVKLADLKAGDELLFNLTGEQTGAPAHCIDIWIGADTFKLVTTQQSTKYAPAKAAPKK